MSLSNIFLELYDNFIKINNKNIIMSLFSEFSTLFPYLQSVRKLKNYLWFNSKIILKTP